MTASRSPSYLLIRMSAAALAVAVLTLQTLTASARPLSKCRLGYQSDYHSVIEGLTDEVRKDLQQRVLIDALDDADIVFRGQLIKRWYLSDVLETDRPSILEVYDHVRILKGEMPSAAEDGKVFLVRERICDGRCWIGALPEVTSPQGGTENMVLAMRNTLANPSEVRDRRSDAVVYSGRVDALLGPCDPRQVNVALATALMESPGEADRLRRSYPLRTAAERQRDAEFVLKRIWGR